MSKFIVSNQDFLNTLCEQAGLDPTHVRRIVLDFEAGSPGRMYVEAFADDEKLRVAFGAGIEISQGDPA